MKKIVLGGALLGAGLGLAALVGLSGTASAGTPSPAPKVTVDCSAEVVPPAGAHVEGFKAKPGESGRAEHGSATAKPEGGLHPQGATHSTAEVKDGRLYIDGEERPLPDDCVEGGPMTVAITEGADTATKAP
ncbi:hypothetical protein [Actinocorallia populi]|uniref:hypothetical protein n=1 Tax=Actinocorallia populi TaxID=2079200 RepID=UPI000D088EFF|nr:hypothetical protein [Actinocorallia populi]